MNYLHNRFTYDHEAGCLRWRGVDDEPVFTDDKGLALFPMSALSRVKKGSVAGTIGFGDYTIKMGGDKKCGMRLIWQFVTNEIVMGKVRTIRPRATSFNIDDLYLVFGRVDARRAQYQTVVSFSYERKQFTVVEVDGDYNKMILSYHDDMNSAIQALTNPIVSFL